jgi:cyclopropane fatty-acyl-phospholipid synthase-like methyltransferase
MADGITLSPVQAQRANELCGPSGLADRCHFQVGDALKQPFSDDTFDLAWALESGEHMPDKRWDTCLSFLLQSHLSHSLVVSNRSLNLAAQVFVTAADFIVYVDRSACHGSDLQEVCQRATPRHSSWR